jgi:hypothetical protein
LQGSGPCSILAELRIPCEFLLHTHYKNVCLPESLCIYSIHSSYIQFFGQHLCSDTRKRSFVSECTVQNEKCSVPSNGEARLTCTGRVAKLLQLTKDTYTRETAILTEAKAHSLNIMFAFRICNVGMFFSCT